MSVTAAERPRYSSPPITMTSREFAASPSSGRRSTRSIVTDATYATPWIRGALAAVDSLRRDARADRRARRFGSEPARKPELAGVGNRLPVWIDRHGARRCDRGGGAVATRLRGAASRDVQAATMKRDGTRRWPVSAWRPLYRSCRTAGGCGTSLAAALRYRGMTTVPQWHERTSTADSRSNNRTSNEHARCRFSRHAASRTPTAWSSAPSR